MSASSLRNWVSAGLAVALAFANRPAVAAPWGWFGGQQSQASAAPQPIYNQAGGVQEPNWAEKMVAPLSPGYWHSGPDAKPKPATPNFEHDPIALQSLSGPPTPSLYVVMAGMADRGGNAEEARRLYQRALEMDPKTVDAVLGLARLEDREGRMEQAIAGYRRAAAVDPKNPTVLNDLALCLARQGQIPESYRLMRTAINLQPKKPLYRNNMAKILIEMNRLDEAMANLKTSASPAVANYNMGVLLAQRGRTAEAKRYLAAALSMEPRMEPARVALAQLTAPTGVRPSAPTVQAPSLPQHSVIQTARNPRPFIMPQEPWSPPVESSATVATTAAAKRVARPQIDDSILPTPMETSPGVAMPPTTDADSGTSEGPALLPAVN